MELFSEFAGLTHREVAGRLLGAGWDVCGVGDWAVVWRSPDGSQVARVCAFEPAYGVFVGLCRALSGHPMLPRVDFDAALAGGGRVTVMEFLLPAEPEAAEAVRGRWNTAGEDDPISAVRREAERANARAEVDVPFWGGLDTNPANVMRRADGSPVLVDLFYADGPVIYRHLAQDPARVAAAFAPEQRAFIDEIAAVTRYSSTEEIAAMRSAAASIAP
ncbi:hypothetical protein AB0B28_13915 [Glycomyces sp. NPDC046736]|uniref:hypothetical protein n=1 Tax=Glycomyces sp. NPDC046736 TaxID=3155615 RepID=UPI0033D9CB07